MRWTSHMKQEYVAVHHLLPNGHPRPGTTHQWGILRCIHPDPILRSKLSVDRLAMNSHPGLTRLQMGSVTVCTGKAGRAAENFTG